ncbi:MAG: hypothetical protein D8M59_07700 [Planctomycetes bacterium]|nr:hypothetical protein [Planctomycetota bacterium]NOG53211.1 hypothetical protein [Planctomycetota bacterium]
MLNPNVRSIYTSALTPPPGHTFAEAIATTFSMDPSLLLQAPVHLALMAGDGKAAQRDAMYAMEAIRRHSDKITAYVQRGRISVPSHATTLFSLLEPMTVEVTSPNGGVFHPKLWLIRFTPVEGGRNLLRLVILSRNLTADRSWDLTLQLEGVVGGRPRGENRPLAELIRRLPHLAVAAVGDARASQAERFAEDVRKVDWELPAGFDEYAPRFYVPGLEGFGWKPEPSLKMAVISPFCGAAALRRLAKSSDEPVALITSAETLASLDGAVVNVFGHAMHLDQAAETEDGEDAPSESASDMTGLHAKAYIFERRYYKDYTHLVMGSANATDAALLAENNIELLVEIVGRTDTVGGALELIGEDGLGEYLVPFTPGEEQPVDMERQAAERSMEAARDTLASAQFQVKCTAGESDGQNRLVLSGIIPKLDGIISTRAWPITVSADHAVVLQEAALNSVLSEGVASASVTGLIAFELRTTHPEVGCRFVLNLPIEGVPANREAAILQTIINNEEGFLRYLLLLLGDESGRGEIGDGPGGTFAKWLTALGAGDDIPLLEELTRTFCRTPDRLAEVRRLIQDLASTEGGEQVVPARFMELWDVFEQALEARHG